MSDRQRRDQRMRGDSAPPIQRTEAERRTLLERLDRLRTPQEPRVEWLDRGTEGRRGTEPSRTTPPRRRSSRHTSPSQTRTDPTYAPPRQTRSEGERREIIERVSPPHSSGGVEWLPPATTGDSSGSLEARLQEQQREIEELQRQYARGTQDRGTPGDTPPRLTRDQLEGTRQPLLPPDHPLALPPNHPLRFQRRLHEGTFRPDRSDIPFLLLPPRELGDRIADDLPRLEAELRQTPVLGNIAGIFLGVWRYFTSIAESLVALPGIIRELFQEIISLDRESLIEIGLLLRDLALASPTDPEVMQPIAEAIWAPVLEIGENFRLGVEAADHDQIESSARITQATLGIIDLIDALGSMLQAIRRSPQYLTQLRRLANLRRLRRRLAVLLEHTRRRLQRSELGRFTLRLLEDERGSLDLDALTGGRRRISIPGDTPSSASRGTSPVTNTDDVDIILDQSFEATFGGQLVDMNATPYRPPSAPFSVSARARQIFRAARARFRSLQPGYVSQLGVGRGGQVHHAIELQVIQRYGPVFTERELNSFANMRGIPPERTASGVMDAVRGRRQLHNSYIRQQWDRQYAILDQRIRELGLQRGSPEYRQFVRQALEDGRREIDNSVGQFFSEVRMGETWTRRMLPQDMASLPDADGVVRGGISQ